MYKVSKEKLINFERAISKYQNLDIQIKEQNIRKVEIKTFILILIIIILSEVGLFSCFFSTLKELIFWPAGFILIGLLCVYDLLIKHHKAILKTNELIIICYSFINEIESNNNN